MDRIGYDDSNFAAIRSIAYAQHMEIGQGPTHDSTTAEALPMWKKNLPWNDKTQIQCTKPVVYHAKDGNAYTYKIPSKYTIEMIARPSDCDEDILRYQCIPQQELQDTWAQYQHVYYTKGETYTTEDPREEFLKFRRECTNYDSIPVARGCMD